MQKPKKAKGKGNGVADNSQSLFGWGQAQRKKEEGKRDSDESFKWKGMLKERKDEEVLWSK